MDQLKSLVFLTCLLAVSACSWRGYVFPSDGDFTKVNARADAYEIGNQNFDTTNETQSIRLHTMMQAMTEVQRIFESKQFSQLMSDRTWAAACDQKPIVQVSGEEVISDLKSLSVRVSIFPKKPFLAVGLTDINNYRIAIDPSRMDNADKDEIVVASQLIETVAHEFTHLITNSKEIIKYRDRGHGKEDCTKNNLVSYRVGRAVQAIWISEQIPPIR